MILTAIDPGKEGAVLTVDSEANRGFYLLLDYAKDGILKADPIKDLIKHVPPQKVFIEKVGGRGGWGATHNFNYGLCYGQLRYLIASSGYPHQLLTPAIWQKTVHEGIDVKLEAKVKSQLAYRNLFPKDPIAAKRKGKAHDGVVDALLILVHAFERFGIISSDWVLDEWS